MLYVKGYTINADGISLMKGEYVNAKLSEAKNLYKNVGDDFYIIEGMSFGECVETLPYFREVYDDLTWKEAVRLFGKGDTLYRLEQDIRSGRVSCSKEVYNYLRKNILMA